MAGSEVAITVESMFSMNRAQATMRGMRSEEHTSELQSHSDLVCRLLLEKKNACDGPLPSDCHTSTLQPVAPIPPCLAPLSSAVRKAPPRLPTLRPLPNRAPYAVFSRLRP